MSRRRPLATATRPPRGAGGARNVERPTGAPAPRKRAVSPTREQRTRTRTRAVVRSTALAVLIVATMALAGQWVLHTSYFRVQNVTFVGLHHEAEPRVLAASGLEAHPTMFGLSASSLQKNLQRFSWITGLSIAKHWPSTLVVSVRESTPVAVAFDAHHVLQYVDASGRDLGNAPLGANLPTLQYLDPRRSTWPYLRAGAAAAYVASRLPTAFTSQVAVVTEDAKGRVTLKMTTPVTFIIGPTTQLHAKFVAIASVIKHTTLRPGDVVDATVPDELAVTGSAPS
jgi:cell division protein FtsQ